MDQNLSYFDATAVYWYWFIFAAVLLVIEATVGSMYFLWLGLGALVTGGLTYFAPDLCDYSLLIWALLSILSLVIWKKVAKKAPLHLQNDLNNRGDRLITRTITLVEPIVNGEGRAKIDGIYWSLKGPDLPENSQVVIVGVEGATLLVKIA